MLVNIPEKNSILLLLNSVAYRVCFMKLINIVVPVSTHVIFSLFAVSITEKTVLNFPNITENCLFLSVVLSLCLMYFVTLLLGAYTFRMPFW